MRRIGKISVAVLLMMTMLLGGCSGKPKAAPDPTDDNYRAFYQIFVGSFSDSNGDGTGDLRGIINRMDYLNDGNMYSENSLGIQGIWLSPIFQSPSYHKYDTSNYYKIDEKFGTEADLVELIELCHERNVKVILDLVINHTSTSHEWFMKFSNAHKEGNKNDPYYDIYSWAPIDERTAGIAYTGIPGGNLEYYECNFSTEMPELNYDNKVVREEMLKVAKYYLDLGIDGFRFDAIKYIYFNDTERSVDFWKWYMDELKAYKPDIYCVGECWSNDNETLQYAEALNCFNFQVAQGEGYISNAAKGKDINVYTKYVEKYQDLVLAANPEGGMMTSFIANHDMDRAAGYLTPSNKQAHMAANLYLLCSGSPFIYYGEEIGLKGTRGSANTDANRRLAMLWGDEDTIKDPMGTTYDKKKQTNGTVAEQLADEESLLHYYGKLMSLRKQYPEIARGNYKALDFGENNFGGFLITYNEGKTVLLHNTSTEEIVIDLSSCSDFPAELKKIAAYIGQGEASLKGTILTMAPQTSVIIK